MGQLTLSRAHSGECGLAVVGRRAGKQRDNAGDNRGRTRYRPGHGIEIPGPRLLWFRSHARVIAVKYAVRNFQPDQLLGFPLPTPVSLPVPDFSILPQSFLEGQGSDKNQ